ncbi:hypothetical protein C8F01DRAFT_1373295 [Mycena amicta]|nr:hypothetical protein C8F01DRAFT_1373295 [Mycena amicta]
MQTDESHNSPVLPPELECYIFRLAATSHLRSASVLMRVAKRVKEWVQPLLYQTLVLPSGGSASIPSFRFEAMLGWTSPELLRITVKNAMLCGSEDEVLLFLSKLPVVQNLFIICNNLREANGNQPPVEFLRLPLRRLYCQPTNVIHICKPSVDPLDYECFLHLTHLHFLLWPEELGTNTASWDDPTGGWTSWAFLARLPCLTHFALPSRPSDSDLLPPNVAAFILSACRCLSALVVFSYAFRESNGIASLAESDARFVTMLDLTVTTPGRARRDDWWNGALCGDDYWARADAHIAKRRSGEIDRTAYKVVIKQ